MISFRRIRLDEVAECSQKWQEKYPDLAEPRWESVWVREDSGKVTAFFGLQQRLVVEPLYADSPRALQETIPYIDGLLSGYKEYEFVVLNNNNKFQAVLENHYGLKGEAEPPHRIYFVRH